MPLALGRLTMAHIGSTDSRAVYEQVFVCALRYAGRLVADGQAGEIAHDVAANLVQRPSEHVSAALIYIKVTSRLRDARRGRLRRAANDGAYLRMRAGCVPGWATPGADVEAMELALLIDRTVAAMPAATRNAFMLVRTEELTYKEAAERLGVGVATIHTQLSRANALLRDCVRAYRAGDATVPNTGKGRRK